jgi:hypothetical protein
LDIIVANFEGSLILLVGQTDDGADLANILLNAEELIHESQLELRVSIGQLV